MGRYGTQYTYEHYCCDTIHEFACSIVYPSAAPGYSLHCEEAIGPERCFVCGAEFDEQTIHELAAQDYIERMTILD